MFEVSQWDISVHDLVFSRNCKCIKSLWLSDIQKYSKVSELLAIFIKNLMIYLEITKPLSWNWFLLNIGAKKNCEHNIHLSLIEINLPWTLWSGEIIHCLLALANIKNYLQLPERSLKVQWSTILLNWNKALFKWNFKF